MMQDIQKFSPIAQKNLAIWLNGHFIDEETKRYIRSLMKTNPDEIENGFYSSLNFGTGGLRSIMGLGPNRLNIYTIRQTTQGVATYLTKTVTNLQQHQISVVVGYDSRNNSYDFAMETARVFAAHGFIVHLFRNICPTPLVSFACRYLQAQGAVMITASHNSAEYNGYKVYWSNGGQVLPPHDVGMIDEVKKIALVEQQSKNSSSHDVTIRYVDQDIDSAYLHAIKVNQLWPHCSKSSLRVLYSCLHGTGIRLMKPALQQAGISSISYVQKQMPADGAFPYARQPNPENIEALSMGVDIMLKEKHDIFLATDPDSDRLGAVVLHQEKAVILTGNQIASIVCEWIFRQFHKDNRPLTRPAVIKTIVTTKLLEAIAHRWHAHTANVLTGFKYIAQKIEDWLTVKEGKDSYTYLFGGEESYGTLFGLHCRDKDATPTAVALAEIAWYLKEKEGKTLVDALEEIYTLYGRFYEKLVTVSFSDTKEGRQHLEDSMHKLRLAPPGYIDIEKVIAIQDLLDNSFSGDTSYSIGTDTPPSDVIIYTLESTTQIIVRPSGTEPKVKIYLLLTAGKDAMVSEDDMKAKAQTLACAMRSFLIS